MFMPQLDYYIIETVVGRQSGDTPEALAGQPSPEVQWVLMGPVRSQRTQVNMW